ncbi:MAG: hypothetical protein D6826_10730 [Alphaproteobacteria bacterium]|nr:MAG: hypothetical protein D6826_10730 [Alphaproteobacteria bacterium]
MILSRSPTARAVMARARRDDVRVCLDSETDLLAYYFAGHRVVGVNTRLSEAGRIVFLAHELAHVPQHPRYSDNRYYPADDLLLLRRVREAAAEAIATRIAWELRRAGYEAVWHEKRKSAYGDVARAFIAALTLPSLRAPSPGHGHDPATEADMMRATRAAFDQWFAARWRRNVYDAMTIDHLERIAADRIGLVPPRQSLSHEFLAGIAWVGTGNFILATGGRRLTDPVYAGTVSRRNARRLARLINRALSWRAADELAMVGLSA